MAKKGGERPNKSAIKVARRLLSKGLEHTCVQYPEWMEIQAASPRTIDISTSASSNVTPPRKSASRRGTLSHETRCKLRDIEWHFGKVLKILGYHEKDDVFQGTPRRMAKAYLMELFSGLDYGRFPRCSKFTLVSRRRKACTESPGQKNDKEKELDPHPFVVVRDIPFTSMCEHHLLPFMGTMTIGYQPRKYVIGLSKVPRMVHFFACRPQMQERLTCQILEALRTITHSKEAGIKIEARHTCVCSRGVKSDSVTTTWQLKHLTPNNLSVLLSHQ